MTLIEDEIKDVQQGLTTQVPSIEIIACHKALVAVKILKTKYRELTACVQFPENYPDAILLVEIKSKVFSPALVANINQICDQELKKYVGQKQVINLIKFLRKFIDENPLIPCRDELTFTRKQLLEDSDNMKMKQKQGHVVVEVKKNKYFLKFSLAVPDDYPAKRVTLEINSHNFPASFAYYFVSQAREFARQAVEPPLRKNKKLPEFKPSPHIQKIMDFLIKKCVKRYAVEQCPLCGKPALPDDPKEVVTDGKHDQYAERVYCGHLFHHGCLDKYMKTPPFQDGKKCPTCSLRIYHDKWNITPRLAEERWAHQEARQRELDEVVDFLS